MCVFFNEKETHSFSIAFLSIRKINNFFTSLYVMHIDLNWLTVYKVKSCFTINVLMMYEISNGTMIDVTLIFEDRYSILNVWLTTIL